MALTVTAPAGGSRVGPGVTVSVHSSLVGPIANNDLISVEVVGPGITNYFVLGAVFAGGSHDYSVLLGADTTDIGFPRLGFWDHDIAPGAACSLVVSHTDHSFTNVEPAVTVGGFVWDPTSALYVLVIGANAGGVRAELAAILAAVRKVFG